MGKEKLKVSTEIQAFDCYCSMSSLCVKFLENRIYHWHTAYMGMAGSCAA